MDALPPHEDVRPFVHIDGLLREAGVNVPEIVAQDAGQGLLLLSDLGQDTFYQRIRAGISDAQLQSMYRDTLATLVKRRTKTSIPSGIDETSR